MSGDREQHVDTNSAEFKQGVQAGLNAGKDRKNWKAGNELGLELKKEVEPGSKNLSKESSTPLFMRDSSEGDKGNAQDEKDETAE
jgi:hypothetical protein